MEEVENFRRLEKNIMQTVYEWQVKIGYAKESMNVYFMKESLCYYCGASLTKEELGDWLVKWKQFVRAKLGEVTITIDKERYCFIIPEQGTAYIYMNSKENTFLEHLLAQIQKQGSTIEDIIGVFKEQSDHVICEKVKSEEFDYVLSYQDKEIDEFRYCFTINETGVYYHRFNEFDYKSTFS